MDERTAHNLDAPGGKQPLRVRARGCVQECDGLCVTFALRSSNHIAEQLRRWLARLQARLGSQKRHDAVRVALKACTMECADAGCIEAIEPRTMPCNQLHNSGVVIETCTMQRSASLCVDALRRSTCLEEKRRAAQAPFRCAPVQWRLAMPIRSLQELAASGFEEEPHGVHMAAIACRVERGTAVFATLSEGTLPLEPPALQ